MKSFAKSLILVLFNITLSAQSPHWYQISFDGTSLTADGPNLFPTTAIADAETLRIAHFAPIPYVSTTIHILVLSSTTGKQIKFNRFLEIPLSSKKWLII